MFGLGMPELILILIIALVVFGPSKLPEMGSSVGKAIREFRSATREAEPEPQKPIEAEYKEQPRLQAVSTATPSEPAAQAAPKQVEPKT